MVSDMLMPGNDNTWVELPPGNSAGKSSAGGSNLVASEEPITKSLFIAVAFDSGSIDGAGDTLKSRFTAKITRITAKSQTTAKALAPGICNFLSEIRQCLDVDDSGRAQRHAKMTLDFNNERHMIKAIPDC
jgi:hypothetical protein